MRDSALWVPRGIGGHRALSASRTAAGSVSGIGLWIRSAFELSARSRGRMEMAVPSGRPPFGRGLGFLPRSRLQNVRRHRDRSRLFGLCFVFGLEHEPGHRDRGRTLSVLWVVMVRLQNIGIFEFDVV